MALVIRGLAALIAVSFAEHSLVGAFPIVRRINGGASKDEESHQSVIRRHSSDPINWTNRAVEPVPEHESTASASNPSVKPDQHTRKCEREAICLGFLGRLGDNLYELEQAVNFARKNGHCYVEAPRGGAIRSIINFEKDGLFKVFKDAPEKSGSVPCRTMPMIGSDCGDRCGFWGGSRRIAGYTVPESRAGLQEAIVEGGLLKCTPEMNPLIKEDTLVMHMRSGDISNISDGNRYPQPPCAFYQKVMSTGNNNLAFSEAVIITEPDMQNPCVDFMKVAFPRKIQVLSRSVTEDACAMTKARHLAVAFGTWGPGLSRLNKLLLNLYVPWGEDEGVTSSSYGGQLSALSDGRDHWFHEAIFEGRTSYNQHIYTFHGFSAGDSGFNNTKMTSFSTSGISVRVIPGLQ